MDNVPLTTGVKRLKLYRFSSCEKSLNVFGCSLSTESGHPAQFVGMSQGPRLWEHNKTPQYSLSPSWPYRMPQNFIQQGNGGYQPSKPFLAQGQTFNFITADKVDDKMKTDSSFVAFYWDSFFFRQVLWCILIQTSHWSLMTDIKSIWISSNRRSKLASPFN